MPENKQILPREEIRRSVRKELFLYMPVHFSAAKALAMYVEVGRNGECTGVSFRKKLKNPPENAIDCTKYARLYTEKHDEYDREKMYDDVTAEILEFLEKKAD